MDSGFKTHQISFGLGLISQTLRNRFLSKLPINKQLNSKETEVTDVQGNCESVLG